MTTRPWTAAGNRARRAALGAALLLAVLALSCGGDESEPETAGAASGVRPASTAPAFTATPGRSAAEVSQQIAAWSAAMCRLQAEFDEGVAAFADGVDPTTLDLEERKLRYQRIGPMQSALYTELAGALGQLQPPPGGRDFHQAVLLQVQQIAAALQRQSELVATAATTEEIDATNEELQTIRLRTRAEVQFANQAMPGAIRAALAACGSSGGVGQP